MRRAARTDETLITIAHGVAGWTLCGAAMGAGIATTTLDRALLIHAAAAPLIFVAITAVYYRRFGYFQPLKAALTFLAVVVALDFFVVALLIEKSFDMFESPLGKWLPFLLISLSTWLTGTLTHRNRARPTPQRG